MNPADLLHRIATTLRQDVGAALDDEYAKSQAFMAAVVLQKVASELASADVHRVADAAAYRELGIDLAGTLRGSRVPTSVTAAVQRFGETGTPESLSELIAALYTARSELDNVFEPLLSRVRRTLRDVLDRRLESAR
jgi:hypothetical protein